MDAARRALDSSAISSKRAWLTRGMNGTLFLSTIFTGVTFKGQFSFLYENEFTAQIDRLLNGRMVPVEIIIWSLIVISHAGIFALIFLVGHKFFYRLLVWAPISYLAFYSMYNILIIPFYLVPFIILWIISLILCWKLRFKRVNPA